MICLVFVVFLFRKCFFFPMFTHINLTIDKRIMCFVICFESNFLGKQFFVVVVAISPHLHTENKHMFFFCHKLTFLFIDRRAAAFFLFILFTFIHLLYFLHSMSIYVLLRKSSEKEKKRENSRQRNRKVKRK